MRLSFWSSWARVWREVVGGRGGVRGGGWTVRAMS